MTEETRKQLDTARQSLIKANDELLAIVKENFDNDVMDIIHEINKIGHKLHVINNRLEQE